jgi:hypothetical protein
MKYIYSWISRVKTVADFNLEVLITFIGSDKVGQTLGTAQSEVGGVLIGRKGSRVKEIPRHLHTD